MKKEMRTVLLIGAIVIGLVLAAMWLQITAGYDQQEVFVDQYGEIIDTESLYLGNWELQTRTVDGELSEHGGALLIFGINTFYSQAACFVSGDMEVQEDYIFTESTDTDCEVTDDQEALIYVYQYDVSDDAMQLTLTSDQFGVEVVEVYQRVQP